MTRHSLDPISLAAGLVFTVVAIAYLLDAHSSIDVDGRWVIPLALIAIGIGGVVGAIGAANRQRRESVDTELVPAAVTSDVDDPALRSE